MQLWSEPYQIDEFGDGDLANGFLHAAQSLQRRSEATGQIVSRDSDEVVLPPVQVKHKDVLDFILAGV